MYQGKNPPKNPSQVEPRRLPKIQPKLELLWGCVILGVAFMSRYSLVLGKNNYLLLQAAMGTAFCVKSVFSFRTARIRRDFAPGSPILRRFLAEQVPVLRWIGFFAEYGGDDVIEAIALKIEEEEPDFAHMIVRHPASLLLLDPSRGLVFDKVIDPVPGNGGLTLLLERAAAVSRGRFAPADIEESVPGDGKIIHIAFSNAGRAHHFDLRSDPRHAVFDFVSKLSDATADDGGMFVIPMIFGKYNALAHITRDDHAILTERLRWQIWVRPDSTTQV